MVWPLFNSVLAAMDMYRAPVPLMAVTAVPQADPKSLQWRRSSLPTTATFEGLRLNGPVNATDVRRLRDAAEPSFSGLVSMKTLGEDMTIPHSFSAMQHAYAALSPAR